MQSEIYNRTSYSTLTQHKAFAFLSPIYGATRKLLDCCEEESKGPGTTAITVTDVRPGVFEEKASTILSNLDAAFADKPFTVLLCDDVASQSGRVLPLEAVADWCKSGGRDVKLVVDGTQSTEVLVGVCGVDKNDKATRTELLNRVDYFVMSTHKWLGNAKTCGIVRFLAPENAPCVPAISFGWQKKADTTTTITSIRSEFSWLGMLDSYVSYITLGLALPRPSWTTPRPSWTTHFAASSVEA
jgi:hypothetical protein